MRTLDTELHKLRVMGPKNCPYTKIQSQCCNFADQQIGLKTFSADDTGNKIYGVACIEINTNIIQNSSGVIPKFQSSHPNTCYQQQVVV